MARIVQEIRRHLRRRCQPHQDRPRSGVKREADLGNEVIVVVSAMSGTTNQLVAWCNETASLHDAREYDTVVASGEQITAGLAGDRAAGNRHHGTVLARLADSDPYQLTRMVRRASRTST